MVTLKLLYPFKFGESRTVEELNFDRLKGKHIKKIGGNPTMQDLLDLASKSCSEPPALFDEMDAEDVVRVTDVIADFLDGSRKTGASA